MRQHIQTLGLFQQPGVEALRDNGDDPYDFKEGDIEYTFSTSKRLKGQGREPSKKAKVGQHTVWKYKYKQKNWIQGKCNVVKINIYLLIMDCMTTCMQGGLIVALLFNLILQLPSIVL